MAQHRGRQGEWPTVKNNPEACFQKQDVLQRSERSVAGPLRLGTEPGVGPRGPSVANGRREEGSDMGMDRVSPREFDPLGTSLTRYGPSPQSGLVAQFKRGGDRRE
jgi:hypothetical protein